MISGTRRHSRRRPQGRYLSLPHRSPACVANINGTRSTFYSPSGSSGTRTTTLTPQDGQQISAYRTGDANAKRGLVVLQEIFGVNSHIRNVCDTFAKQGYD